MNFGDMSGLKQWAVLLAGAALVTVALFFTVFKTQREANAQAEQELQTSLQMRLQTSLQTSPQMSVKKFGRPESHRSVSLQSVSRN